MADEDGRQNTPCDDVVLEILDGCAEEARTEAGELGEVHTVSETELRLRTDPGIANVLSLARNLRTVVSAYLCCRIPSRRPQEILETSAMRHLGQQLHRVQRLRPRSAPMTGLRLAAAGSHTPVMVRLAEELADAAQLPLDPDDGDLLVRVRPAARSAGEEAAWEVLIRLTPRPLSTRAWRIHDYPGALNATIAASILERMNVDAEDSVLDMTCGSGTFLIEQSFRSAPHRAVGIDISPEAIHMAHEHQRAARRKGKIEWITGDVLTTPIEGEFTKILANPPWGELHGEHATNQALLAALLERAAVCAGPDARLGILTHEIRRMHAVLDAPQCPWILEGEHRYFQKGHHPRLFTMRLR